MCVQIEVNMKELQVGTGAPVWIPDARVSMCMLCQEEFSFAFRRHHCRGCGKVPASPVTHYSIYELSLLTRN